jgi:hypothetical protein
MCKDRASTQPWRKGRGHAQAGRRIKDFQKTTAPAKDTASLTQHFFTEL